MSSAQAPELRSLSKASRQAGLSVLLGGAIVAAALAASAIQLTRLQQSKAELEQATRTLQSTVTDLETRKQGLLADKNAIERALKVQREEVSKLEQQKSLLLQSVKELSPPAQAVSVTPARITAAMARANASDLPPNAILGAAANRQYYEFSVWLALPKDVRSQVKRVTYTFDHPTFRQKRLTSTDAASGFRVSYRGWGCLGEVRAEVLLHDSSKVPLSFDQCAAIVGDKGAKD